MSKTYTLSMANSWTKGTFTISHTTAGKVTVKVKLTRPDGGTSYNYDASKNFYITIAGTTYKHTVTKVAGTSGTSFSSSKTVTLSGAGTASVAVKVGGSLSGTTFKITGNNSKTYSITDGEKATYTIKYNANGGTGAPASQTKTYGTTLKLSSTVPTRASETNGEGDTISYTFRGWSTSSTATSVTYAAGANYTANAGATLYAVWADTTTINSYDVIYETDGGSEITPQVKPKGTALTLTSAIPEKLGYTFNGWNTSSDGSGTSYNSGATYSTDADLVLHAIWIPWTHTVQFNANGGTGAPSNIVKTTDVDVFIPETEPTRSGYMFNGWNTVSDGSGISYMPEYLYTYVQNGGTVTLYAIWTTTDILLYSNDNCKAVEFVEDSEITGFGSGGIVYGAEFIEGETIKIGQTALHFAEIIER